MTQSVPPHPAPNHCRPKRVCEPLLHSYLPFSMNSVVIFFSFLQFCCPLWYQSSHWCQLWEGFLLHGNFFSFTTPSPGQLSILTLNPLSLFLSLSFVLPHFEEIGLSFWGIWVQKLFCGSCSTGRWSFDVFVGERVVSASYSSAILGLPMNGS